MPRSRLYARLIVFFVLVLFVWDFVFLKSSKAFIVIKAGDYAVRLIIGLAVATCCLYWLLGRRAVSPIGVLVLLYVGWVFFQFLRFLNEGSLSNTAIFINPSFSIFVWLFPLLIVGAHKWRLEIIGEIPNHLYSLFLFGLLAIGFTAYLIDLQFEWGFYYPVIAILVYFFCCLMAARKVGSSVAMYSALLLTAALMLMTGYRTYALAAFFTMMCILFGAQRAVRAYMVSAVVILVPLIYLVLIQLVDDEFIIFNYNVLADTRTFLMEELWSDLSLQEVVFGRGLDAQYFSAYFYDIAALDVADADFYMRSGSEMAFLNIILKLGIVGLVLFLFINFYAIWPTRRSDFSEIDSGYLDGMRIFALVMLLLFSVEIPHAINFTYALWFVVLGCLCGKKKSLRVKA